MIGRYYQFLKRSLHTFDDDIARPYHKVIDLVIKLTSLSIAAVGGYLLVTASSCYFSLGTETLPTYCASLFDAVTFGRDHQTLFQVALMRSLSGIGALLIALFMSQVLVVRHLNETLPDHIYLRCFSTKEEKKARSSQ